MAININIPDIGLDALEVTEILVKVGDLVKTEQSLITVEGDKASMEIPSPQEGKVKEIKVMVGDQVTTGKLIMTFDELESIAENTASKEPEIKNQLSNIKEESMNLAEVLVKVDDEIKTDQSFLTIEEDMIPSRSPTMLSTSEKTSEDSLIMVVEVTSNDTTSLNSRISNKAMNILDASDTEIEVTKIMIKVGDKICTAHSLVNLESETGAIAVPSTLIGTLKKIKIISDTSVSPPETKYEFAENDAYVHASPIIRRLAREFGINLTKVKGTGRKGRILQKDIQDYIQEIIQYAENTSAGGGSMNLEFPTSPTVDFSIFGDTEVVELKRIQKISGANLHRNWIMIPHVTQFDEVDITDMERFRIQQNTVSEKKKLGVKITPLVFIMKAVAKALEEWPLFNSSLSPDTLKVTLKKYINIGIAVDTSHGLVVPVFRHINKKGIMELSRELAETSKKAREGKLTTLDMQGGCFTISSLGGIGGAAFTPIVKAPEVAILGVSKSSMKPVWDGKEFTPRLMLPLSLSYNHRVIDGADGARFINCINSMISDIRRLLI
ncbi:2-oxo acid dehydrogenase subunit E2 [Candidatus Steffania adelgidicola]|uniref:2-oxo acid dehydrogenase subunit E2 n=1 Tax=Candidatus Steffania adelgidicola TaxID=1076626 RepID=UPI001D00ECEA|nr:2-oxo acid dehydrogenase subunit E2 [Candidatus Steffania adelgidicola]UDG80147.1 Dihydrolipoyllysine-residue acetyltransferase component of pyruvate dehydrogenase complex [Candidatus Steffania adelgidicola]